MLVARLLLRRQDMANLGGLYQAHYSTYKDVDAASTNEHGLNTCVTIAVDHCTQCGLWFEDEVRDQSAWEDHCVYYYNDQFFSFHECVEGNINLQLHGVGIHDNIVMFNLSNGLGGSHLELYGYIEQNVAAIPLYCPYCIFDETGTIKKDASVFTQDTLIMVVRYMNMGFVGYNYKQFRLKLTLSRRALESLTREHFNN
ncbi:hypothetical protein ARMSODRAFT_983988 [Armillaria solidipes]|uniref:Uncharacterized protein n=1 Tax=Armillaria solidipes TaxID=1076256 RepID=A0A2H3AH63_9AGAR|nr:hypothetical protein ARMSODRAFT_983988 [Armillaria solidipes]